MNELNLEYDFEKLNIINKEELIKLVNTERLSNNPINLDNKLKYFWCKYN